MSKKKTEVEKQEAPVKEELETKVEKQEPVKEEAEKTKEKPKPLIYVGPSFLKANLNRFNVYKGKIPKHLEKHTKECPSLSRLFVPVDKLPATTERIKRPGTSESVWFKKVLDYIGGVK